MAASESNRLMFAGIVLVYLVVVALTFHHVEEDAYIYFRFAANIANGHGYVFNPGGEIVESGTSLIWQLLLVPIYWLDPEMVLGTKALAIAFGILCLWMTQKVARCFVEDPVLAWIPSLWLACSHPFYLWSHLGLETPLFLFLVLCLLQCLLRPSLYRYWPWAAFAVAVCRPEGVMLCAALLPSCFRRDGARVRGRQVVVFLALMGAVELFRLVYFHDVVPHSVYHKIRLGGGFPWEWLLRFLIQSWVVIPVAIALPLLVRRASWGYQTSVLLVALVVASYWGPTGVDGKYYDRSFLVMLPLVYVLAVHAVWPLLRESPRRYVIGTMLLVAFGPATLFLATSGTAGADRGNPLRTSVAQILAGPYSPREHFAHFLTPHSHLVHDGDELFSGDGYIYDDHQVMLGEFVRFNYDEGISVVYDQMGKTPWYAGLDKVFIDSLGLVDRPIGYAGFNRKVDQSTALEIFETITTPVIRLFGGDDRARWDEDRALDYVFDQNPELIMAHRMLVRRSPDSLPAMILRDSRLATRYTKKYIVNYTTVYERNDLAQRSGRVIYPDNCRCRRVGGPLP